MEQPILNHLRDLAVRAHNGTSFSPEKRGDSYVKEYSQELTADLATIAEAAEQHGQNPTEAQARYAAKYERYFASWLSSKSNCISSMITGPSRFPTAYAQKRNRWADNKHDEFREWRRRVLAKICKSFAPKTTPTTELEAARADLAKREKQQEVMKAANKIIRTERHDIVGKLCETLNVNEATARKLLEPGFAGRTGFPAYALTNNNAQITRLKKRIEELEVKSERHEAGEKFEQVINGVRILENYEADRVQMFFDGKPEPAIIAALKSNGWKWSPYNKAWQRKITPYARHDAQAIAKKVNP